MEVCSQCGASSTTAYSEAARAVLCERCYGHLPSAREQRAEGIVVKLPGARRPERPRWRVFREWVIASMVADGCWHYMSADRCAGRCPICREPLSVRFIGRTPEADIECSGGCAAADVARRLGKASTVGA